MPFALELFFDPSTDREVREAWRSLAKVIRHVLLHCLEDIKIMTAEKTIMTFVWRVYGLGVMASGMVCLAWGPGSAPDND